MCFQKLQKFTIRVISATSENIRLVILLFYKEICDYLFII